MTYRASCTHRSHLLALLAGLLLVGVLAVEQAQAQECPFTEDEAVADTLDPKGYYPLEIGNLWEYVSYSGAFLSRLRREEVIADTLIEGEQFKKLRVISFDAQMTTIITRADTSYHYRSVVDGVLQHWTAQQGITASTQFFHDFNTCYERDTLTIAVVEGEYDATFTFQSGDTFALAAKKEFTFLLLQAAESEEYGYGLGLLRTGGEPNVHRGLTYARIDGQAYGTPLDSLFDIRVATEARSLPSQAAPQLDIYPNPSSTLTHFALVHVQSGRVTIRVYDVLGRLVAEPLHEAYMTTGENTLAWDSRALASGIYVARVFLGGRSVTSQSFFIAR